MYVSSTIPSIIKKKHARTPIIYSTTGFFIIRIVAWLWEFGDAKKSVSTEQNPTFVYLSDGTFTIKLTVTDDNGLSATAKKDLTILDPAKAINVMWQKETQNYRYCFDSAKS